MVGPWDYNGAENFLWPSDRVGIVTSQSNDTEELLRVVPGEMTNEEFMDVEQEHTTEAAAREMGTAGEEEEPPQENPQWRV